MTIDQLLYFIKVAETLNLTKASEELFMSESALSKSIKRMEKELGSDLFIRNNNRLALTDYGAFLQKHARIIANEWSEVVSYNKDRKRSLIICSNDTSILQNAVGFFINSYDKKESSSDVKEFLLSVPEIEELFNRNECDISFTIGKIMSQNVITIEYEDLLSVAYHKTIVDSLPSSADLCDLPFEEYITLESSGPISAMLKSYSVLHDVRAEINYQNDFAILVNRIMNTNTPAIMTKAAARKLDANTFGTVDLVDDDLKIHVNVSIAKRDYGLRNHIKSVLHDLKLI